MAVITNRSAVCLPVTKMSSWVHYTWESIFHALPRFHFPCTSQVKMNLFRPSKTTLLFVIVINTKVWIYADEILLRWPKDFCSMNIPLVLCWMFALFLTVHSDSTWVSGACSKGRYSEGILCVFLPVPASLLALWQLFVWFSIF